MFRAVVFFGLIEAAIAGEPFAVLVNASAGFSTAIQQQLAAVQGDPSPVVFAERTIAVCESENGLLRGFARDEPFAGGETQNGSKAPMKESIIALEQTDGAVECVPAETICR